MAHDEKKDVHGTHHDELAHPLAPGLLIAIWVALMAFTGLTVWAAQQGLGSQMSFTVAMIIATVKAGLVMAVFMHLWWEKRMNVLAFLGCFLFVMLFIGMLLADKSEYTPDIAKRQADEQAQGAK